MRSLRLVLDVLERSYGLLEPPHPTDPYEMVLYNNCGYPSTDASCGRAFDALRTEVGLSPDEILAVSDRKLTDLMRLGGIVPEIRAERIKQIAQIVKHTFSGDLRQALKKPQRQARKALKMFPTIGDPGADKILLFTRTLPIAAVPSNCVHVPLRLGFGEEKKNYAASYRSAQEHLQSTLPANCDAFIRAYLLLKRHGQELCKRSRPLCTACPLSADCPWFQRHA